ncbi:translation elongation factor G [Candidatus Woesebacteria bacterium RIFCSPHIGHO2_02_FULL_42_20]|uniref:Elongation factor G n=1 Tax=Candidatus Woesebacteria bacterium RIFCSPHIGHO2_12_FULL_41_24 TaxID=1802510 RepID=A0A1F8AUJ3_9BACT|nr:MAG: translation elongation factor G [Candidatus Woesebacteria bacterium RBG_16_41_13]OGM30098.1 MAG: translation elongation factor G [Candidatus Woesebacteria bacterium RIFCSPHIGHO2_01_FULL_42_80]OGM35698.1 MAG: translation elongation factor G [Candidatus Woesebacteria bacterium RIFCSPHIGHO2_02_FULL_42_20]OGM55391.1 MAG: translation elongation factor G [Candidatus Woesebacteria bacterium RIFCSPHIGHO2_12_FULL_41_24]OGM71393.1 MAG: translation elongation factor G [Candidatus Woesebacteria bac
MTVTRDRVVPLEKIRNIGIIAHIDAGKTTTTERILFETGRTYKLGSVDEGTTVTDWMAQERERGITIVSAAITTFWDIKKKSNIEQGHYRINIIDTPGHIDFTAEVERSLRVLDGAVMVFDGRTGVESQSETVWRQADRYKVPRICILNKLNLIGADFDGSIKSIRDRLGANAAAIQMPIGIEHSLTGVVDLVSMKAFTYDGVESNKLEEGDIPSELLDKAKELRGVLIEKIAEFDDEALAKYLDGKDLAEVDVKRAIRAGVVAGKFFPILGGDNRTATAQLLMNAVVEFLPSPIDLPDVEGTDPSTGEVIKRKRENEEAFSALAFKVITDPHVGRLVYLRIYSGILKSGQQIFNTSKRINERIGKLVLMHADQRELIEEAFAGEIVAAVGIKDTTTGNTLSEPGRPVLLESITFPEPVISLAIEPATKQDLEKMGLALKKLSDEDPTFKIKTNHETGQTIISGMGELQLEVLVDRMKREFNVEAKTGAPQVAYKETIKAKGLGEGKYIRQTGGRGQYGHCFLRVEPKNRGEGFEFVNAVKGGSIPNEFIPAVEKGVREKLENGILAGFPMVDLQVTLYDGTYHDVDSSEIAFKIAGSMAVEDAVRRSLMILLEPIMKVEVSTPTEFMGDIIGDLSSRRAQIQGTEDKGIMTVVNALAPLSELSGYATVLRSITQGRATPYVEPSHYEEVPKNIQEQIVAKSGKSTAN